MHPSMQVSSRGASAASPGPHGPGRLARALRRHVAEIDAHLHRSGWRRRRARSTREGNR